MLRYDQSNSSSEMGVSATHLTSAQNPLLKEIRKAVARGGLTAGGQMIAETFHLLDEALRSECNIRAVVVADSVRSTADDRIRGLRNPPPVLSVPDSMVSDISATESSQGVIALVEPRQWTIADVVGAHSLVVALDGIQDPGNAGAILRAAEAFGATGALFIKGSVNPFNPKAIRGSAGSIFRLPVVVGLDPGMAAAALQQSGLDVYAAMADGAKAVADVDLRRRCALIIGSEGRGVSAELRAAATGLRIPTAQVESLNAALAAGILLYEARRQRALTP